MGKNNHATTYCSAKIKEMENEDEKAELLEVIGKYHDGLLPLIVPMTLLHHYINKYSQQYLKGQLYLAPHPAQLMLRNHV